jgi:hypothetical protein
MEEKFCALSILVARTDVPFIDKTIPALVRACQYDFCEVVLFVDTAPLQGAYKHRCGIGTHEDLLVACEALKHRNVVSRIEEIPYDRKEVRRLYDRFFNVDLGFTHDFRGAPIYGSLYSIAQTAGDYIVHFDSDILLYSKQGYSWIEHAIELVERNDEILFISPLSGPPSEDAVLHQGDISYRLDPRGFYVFKDFTSRKYLFSRVRLEESLPYEPLWISQKRKLLSGITSKSALWSWEIIVSKKLRDTHFIRADIKDPRAWTLHTPDHGPEFIQKLPHVIELVGKSQFPSSQRGHYDLKLHDWVC